MKTPVNTLALIIGLLLFGSISSQAQKAEQWKLDKDHTSVNFDVKHFFSTVNGNFNDFDGNFRFHADDLKNSRFSFVIPVSSINTNNQKRDDHLRSDDFFDAANHPEIRFESDRIEKKSSNNYVAHGNLTIKDITRKVSVPFKVTGLMQHPMMEDTRILGLAFETQLDRSDYQVGVGNWASDMVVGDKVGVAVNMELNQKGKAGM